MLDQSSRSSFVHLNGTAIQETEIAEDLCHCGQCRSAGGGKSDSLRALLRDTRHLGDQRTFLDFSDTWQLIINTGTTIVTFLMVFLIQNTTKNAKRLPAREGNQRIGGRMKEFRPTS